MKTPENNNSIDFVPVNLEDAGNTESPAEHAKRLEKLDEKFTVEQPKPNPVIEPKQVVTPEKKIEPEPEKIEKPTAVSISPENGNPNEVLSPDDFVKKFGSSNMKKNFQQDGTKEFIAREIVLEELPPYQKVATTILVPALGAVAIGAQGVSWGALASGVVVPAGLAGVVVIGAGFCAYSGYKMFKSWREKRAFKNNFGVSAKDLYEKNVGLQ